VRIAIYLPCKVHFPQRRLEELALLHSEVSGRVMIVFPLPLFVSQFILALQRWIMGSGKGEPRPRERK